jgi:hypothetical protein
LLQFDIHNIGQGLAAFGSGAAAGVLSLYGPAGWVAGGAIVGSTNAWLTGDDPIKGGIMGGVTGLVGGAIGSWASAAIGGVVVNGIHVTSPLLQGTIIGSLGSGATGGIMSFGLALFEGANFNDVLNASGKGTAMGLATGAISGAGSAYANSVKNGVNPFNGKVVNVKNTTPNYDFTPNPNGDNITMYRGTTGSEGNGRALFMTDNPEYAASYVKNGGQVIQVTIPRSTYMQMLYNGHIQTYQGLHGSSSGFEYQIDPSVAPKFLNSSKF